MAIVKLTDRMQEVFHKVVLSFDLKEEKSANALDARTTAPNRRWAHPDASALPPGGFSGSGAQMSASSGVPSKA